MTYHRYSIIGGALVLLGAALACNEPVAAPAHVADAAVQASVSGNEGDLAAMQRIVDTFDDAATAGDGVRYAAQYAGAEWMGPDGRILTDPQQITDRYVFLLTGPLAGTVRQSTIRDLTFLTGTIAVLDIEARVTRPGTPIVVRAREKNILLKRAGEWRIIEHQHVIVAEGVP